MKFYAVAAVKSGDKVIGARLLSRETLRVSTFTDEKIKNILVGGNEIRNLTLENGKVAWSQGVSSRYPTIEASNVGNVDNTNSIVVIGSYENEQKATDYVVANYIGNVVTISESKLIEYGKQYTLANCKVNNKDGKSYIVSLSGELDKINSGVEFDYDVENKTIIVNVPFTGVSKLVIPERIKGCEITEPVAIEIYPTTLVSKITHLVMPKTIKYLTVGAVSSVRYIKLFECHGTPKRVDGGLFMYNNQLTGAYFKSLYNRTYSTFCGLTNLQTVQFGIRPTVIGGEMFEDCKNYDISNMLYEGLTDIGNKSFKGCDKAVDVNLPNSLIKLSTSAFENCKNIKSLRFNNSTTEIVPARVYNKVLGGYEDVKLLAESPNAVIYCPYSFPVSKLKEFVAEHVKIIKDEPTADDNGIVKKQLKAQVMGVQIRKFDVAKTAEEAVGVLSMLSNEKWQESLIEFIKASLAKRSWGTYNGTIGDKGAFLNIQLEDVRGNSLVTAKAGANYLCVVYKMFSVVILLDKMKTKKYIEYNIERRAESVVNVEHYRNEGIEDKKFTLRIPSKVNKIRSSNVKNIYEKEGSLVIELKDGRSINTKLGGE